MPSRAPDHAIRSLTMYAFAVPVCPICRTSIQLPSRSTSNARCSVAREHPASFANVHVVGGPDLWTIRYPTGLAQRRRSTGRLLRKGCCDAGTVDYASQVAGLLRPGRFTLRFCRPGRRRTTLAGGMGDAIDAQRLFRNRSLSSGCPLAVQGQQPHQHVIVGDRRRPAVGRC